jgi:hypothetical protein
MLGDNEREQNEAIDPPDNTGGGKQSLDSGEEEAAAIDPPDNSGGGN